MALMAEVSNNYFDLAIVDPPYGIGNRLTKGGGWAKERKDSSVAWDIKPAPAFFKELDRVSRNWIIWGGNYFADMLPPCRQVLVWVKPFLSGMTTMSDCEIALASMDGVSRTIALNHDGGDRSHPTQKPIKLYDWLLSKYAKPGQRILDTHLGSGSHAIAAHYAGVHLTACELNKDYYNAACKRIERETAQLDMFAV
tara:strand:- start:23 stop:613 length:591 start_codon:yes stop_codon:yes gene_type:complete